MLKKTLKKEKGFTLIELLAVIVIIAIIAAIAIPAIGNIIQNSREDGVKSDALQILEAAQLYKMEVNPASADGTDTTVKASELETQGYLELSNDDFNDAEVNLSAEPITITVDVQAGNTTLSFDGSTKQDINEDESGDDATTIPNS
ncbi:prepilin-type N-terminal cleavage/methylation domain-containing protein [Virgibacillus sp. MSP4-1]|uniref:prepilin-type N-terminal cleavage/methylation domain-containing protein n=1 Tax=Virgibacillus sp. MSP4-1 TaxID=2700081 RepID=UPI0003A9A84A|nr:prepilin-type N-terminal cleavage/methylation domain-containing protein [Virgibacillus sp. MSP4-1]QHS24270.1 prepilin-type N-terminal cleavage/methylation domain-containing protein [Virgibacillus sp. MSP4-1]